MIKTKIIGLLIGAFLMVGISGCDILEEVANEVISAGGESTGTAALTNEEVIKGLKEALIIGIQNGAGKASLQDGFFKNDLIKLPFPEDAQALKDKAIEWGLQGKVDEITLTLNRAAEEASKLAAPIFIDAIKNMSITDGFNILKGGENAATNFLKEKTSASLIAAFAPVVHDAIEKVKLTSYWEPVATRYNQFANFTGKEKVNPDLDNYVTQKGIDGLFTLVAEEENKIRKDPAARVTEILQKVFGSL